MKAAIVTKKGGPDVVSIRDVPIPAVSPRQVLIRVRAGSIPAVSIEHEMAGSQLTGT